MQTGGGRLIGADNKAGLPASYGRAGQSVANPVRARKLRNVDYLQERGRSANYST